VELVLTQKFADIPKWFDFDLTVSQVKAVFLLAYHGTLTISELAKLLEMGNPAASILVQQLVQQEMVRRSEDPKDRRRTYVQLTAKGASLISGRREQREVKFRRWMSRMSDEEISGLWLGTSALARIIASDLDQPGATIGKLEDSLERARNQE
ncbi:MAG: MarR family transcriptional regulator, partial [Chloroflexota bacterium]